ncbi:MAG: hypothetical protein ACPH3N_01085, partial [Alcanivorax sediminis]|uniref:hypothetical protein n=1 Tax=Alcanivorax sediminis TaxID=2663008 RepID=UPI003C4928B0
RALIMPLKSFWQPLLSCTMTRINQCIRPSMDDGKVASWQVPDKVIFVEDLPLGATGKVMKNQLRERFGEILMTAEG